MSVPGVVEYAGLPASANDRHHVGHHRAKSCPWHDSRRADARKIGPHPIYKRLNTIGSNVAVEPVEFRGAGNAKSIHAKPTGDDLRSLIEQTDMRSGILTLQRFKL